MDMNNELSTKVLITRPAGKAGALPSLLRRAGFRPVDLPLVEIIAHPEGWDMVRRITPSSFTGIFLSSQNGLRQLQQALNPEILAAWMKKPFYLVGEGARPLVTEMGGMVAFVPRKASLAGFLEEYRQQAGTAGLPMAQRWLHPCSTATRLDPPAFRLKGIEIGNVPVYRPQTPKDAAGRLAAEGMDAGAVLFCSGSAVESFFNAAPRAMTAALGTPGGLFAVSIGPSATSILKERGVKDIHEARQGDDTGLLGALRRAYGSLDTLVLGDDRERKT